MDTQQPEEIDRTILKILYRFFPEYTDSASAFASECERYLSATKRYTKIQREQMIDACKKSEGTETQKLTHHEAEIVESFAKAFPLYAPQRDKMHNQAYAFLKQTEKYSPEHIITEVHHFFQQHAFSHHRLTDEDMRILKGLSKALPPYHPNRSQLLEIAFEHLKATGRYSPEVIDTELERFFEPNAQLNGKMSASDIEMLDLLYQAYAALPEQIPHIAQLARNYLQKSGYYSSEQIEEQIKRHLRPIFVATEEDAGLTAKDLKKVKELASAFPFTSPQHKLMREEAYLYLKGTKQYSEGQIRKAMHLVFHSKTEHPSLLKASSASKGVSSIDHRTKDASPDKDEKHL